MYVIAGILTVIFVAIFLIKFCSDESDINKGACFLLLLSGIGATIFWTLGIHNWKNNLSEKEMVITEAISKMTQEDEDDIASLIYLCRDDASIMEMLQVIDKNITEEEAKNFESLILKQLEKEE